MFGKVFKVALKKCKECSHEVSTKADKCPNCGTRMPRPGSAIFILVFLVSFVLLIVVLSDSNKKNEKTKPSVVPISSYPNKLKAFLDTNIESGLVHSYKFSEYERVAYVKPQWYLLDVDFKKKFLSVIRFYLGELVGQERFDIRDYRSNELLAEATTFTGTIKIYK